MCIKLYLEQERIHEFRTLVLLRNGSCVALGLGQRPGHHQSMGVWWLSSQSRRRCTNQDGRTMSHDSARCASSSRRTIQKNPKPCALHWRTRKDQDQQRHLHHQQQQRKHHHHAADIITIPAPPLPPSPPSPAAATTTKPTPTNDKQTHSYNDHGNSTHVAGNTVIRHHETLSGS